MQARKNDQRRLLIRSGTLSDRVHVGEAGSSLEPPLIASAWALQTNCPLSEFGGYRIQRLIGPFFFGFRAGFRISEQVALILGTDIGLPAGNPDSQQADGAL